MAMQICNKRVTQVTANLVRQIVKPVSMNTDVNHRHAHTDIQVPNFDYYRRKGRLDASKSYRDSSDTTSPYSYLTPLGKLSHSD